MKRSQLMLAILLILSLTVIPFLAACGAPSPSTTAPATTTTAPATTNTAAATTTKPATTTATTSATKPEGKLTVALVTLGDESFDPSASISTVSTYVYNPMFEFLCRSTPSGSTEGIAQSWEMAPDGLSWIFHITKGIKWQNGDDLTANDVKFTLDDIVKRGNPGTDVAKSMDRAEVVDDYTVRVYTKGVQVYFPRYLDLIPGIQGQMLPKNYIEKNGFENFKKNPIGSGPFKFVSRTPGDSIVYQAMATHYRQTAAFKDLTLVKVGEEATRVALLKTGEVDIAEIGLDSVPDLQAAGLRTIPLHGSQTGFTIYGAFDPTRGKGMPTSDLRVRQALSLAINRDEIGKNLFYGKMLPPMPPSLWQDQPEINVAYWKDYSAKLFRYDVKGAKDLLNQAGYPQGFSIKLYVYGESESPWMPQMAQVIQGYWQKIGVNAQITPIEKTAFKAMQRTGPGGSPPDNLVGQAVVEGTAGKPVPQQGMYHFSPKGTAAVLQEQFPEFDALYASIIKELNPVTRQALIAKYVQAALDFRVQDVFGTIPGVAGLGKRVDLNISPDAYTVPLYLEYATHPK